MLPDVLGDGFEQQTFDLPPDAEGPVAATLVRKRPATPARHAILYVHGYVDYFFQRELADRVVARGLNFYALDLRKYGRSLRPYQTANYCTSLDEYFPDLDAAVDFIKRHDGNTRITIVAHSTGGLIASLYAHHRRETLPLAGLILNSPFFDVNVPWIVKRIAVPIACAVGRFVPKMTFPLPDDHLYGHSLHIAHRGIWEYNTAWKPIDGIPLRLGWLNAIRRGQRELRHGLAIPCPILVLSSTRSLRPTRWREEIHRADIVLDVRDIAKYARMLGDHVTSVQIDGGIHDLLLSREPVRSQVYDVLFQWLDTSVVADALAEDPAAASRARTIMDAVPVIPAADPARYSS